MSELPAAKQLVEQLSREPRAAGSEAEASARSWCADFLALHGFEVKEEEFTYSALPGRWGLPFAGIVLLVIGSGILVAFGGPFRLAPVVARIAFSAVAIAVSVFSFVGVRGSVMRVRGTNLVATRGGAEPRLWLAAHLDTKSQPVPTLVRTVGVVLAMIVVSALLLLYFVDAVVEVPVAVWTAFGLAAVIAAVPLMASTVGDSSPGAADNASGVAAVLHATVETGHAPLGVLLTSAEELGLAGARAWAEANWPQEKPMRPHLLVNCDTLDDDGLIRCLRHRAEDEAVAREVVRVAVELGNRATVIRATPGIMVDSAALAARAIPSVTLSRVTWRTLARIHTPRDVAAGFRGDGVVRVAGIMSTLVRAHA